MPPTIPDYRPDVTIHGKCPYCAGQQQVTGPSSPVVVDCLWCNARYLARLGEDAELCMHPKHQRKRNRRVRG